jgi:hypothetical protein
MLLPPTGGTTHTSTRARLIAVGERVDEEIRQEITENRKPDKLAKQMIIGIDGAFGKGRPPTDRANLEIITGQIEVDAEPSKMFAVVRDQDGHAKQHVQALLRQSGRSLETKRRVVSDGEDGMRSLVGKLFNANEQRLAKLWSYLTANQTRLINYAREYREGHRISTARVESTVDQLVDWRMEKKQHMRWTRRGAQMLLHARCALPNGELGKYTRWLPSESSQVLAVAA